MVFTVLYFDIFSPVPLGTNPNAPCKGPLCDIFLRFLNEPDPSDPNSRLAAPIVYLPAPERLVFLNFVHIFVLHIMTAVSAGS